MKNVNVSNEVNGAESTMSEKRKQSVEDVDHLVEYAVIQDKNKNVIRFEAVYIDEWMAQPDSPHIWFSDENLEYKGILIGECCEMKLHWSGHGYTICREGCDYCKDGAPKSRFAFNFVLCKGEKMKVHILELPVMAFSELCKILKGRDGNQIVKIRRYKKGSMTRYHSEIIGTLSPEQETKLASLELHDLKIKMKEKYDPHIERLPEYRL